MNTSKITVELNNLDAGDVLEMAARRLAGEMREEAHKQIRVEVQKVLVESIQAAVAVSVADVIHPMVVAAVNEGVTVKLGYNATETVMPIQKAIHSYLHSDYYNGRSTNLSDHVKVQIDKGVKEALAGEIGKAIIEARDGLKAQLQAAIDAQIGSALKSVRTGL